MGVDFPEVLSELLMIQPGCEGSYHPESQSCWDAVPVSAGDPLPVGDSPGELFEFLLSFGGVHFSGLGDGSLEVYLEVNVLLNMLTGLVSGDGGLPVGSGGVDFLLPLEFPVGPEVLELGVRVSPCGGCFHIFNVDLLDRVEGWGVSPGGWWRSRTSLFPWMQTGAAEARACLMVTVCGGLVREYCFHAPLRGLRAGGGLEVCLRMVMPVCAFSLGYGLGLVFLRVSSGRCGAVSGLGASCGPGWGLCPGVGAAFVREEVLESGDGFLVGVCEEDVDLLHLVGEAGAGESQSGGVF